MRKDFLKISIIDLIVEEIVTMYTFKIGYPHFSYIFTFKSKAHISVHSKLTGEDLLSGLCTFTSISLTT
jgi:hypothetical protein